MVTMYHSMKCAFLLFLTLNACSNGGGGGNISAHAPFTPPSQITSTPPETAIPPSTSGPHTFIVSPPTGDATAILQSNLDRIRQAGGGQLTLLSGRYLLTDTLHIPSNTTIRGVGSQTVLAMAPAMTTPGIVNDAYDTTLPIDAQINLRDFAIEGGRATPRHAFTGYGNVWNASIAFQKQQFMLNTRDILKIYQSRTTCVTASSGNGPSQATNGIVDGTCVWDYIEPLWTPVTDPVLLFRLDGGLIDHVTVSLSRNNGLILALATSVTVQDSTFTDNNKNGLYLSNTEHITVTRNVFANNYADIGIANTWHSEIRENVGTESVNYFIGVGRDDEYVLITKNTGGRFATNNESITGTAHGKTYPLPYDAFRYGMYFSTVEDNAFTQMHLMNSTDNLIQRNTVGPTGKIFNGVALWVHGSSGNVFLDNHLMNGESWGVVSQTLTTSGSAEMSNPSIHNTYAYNTVVDTRQDGAMLGFYLDDESLETIMHDNTVNLSPSKPLPAQRYTLLPASINAVRNQ